mmetsp:Transcript_2845/g.9564  ORF Transcript_2845/g.9564 Transcript_2845/m.9564 type:complete len:314 (-) Transcript_2845:505-1446(-)
MSAASMATRVPLPMAMPTSAWASAGESLMPSPTMATPRCTRCRSATHRFFSAGKAPARTRAGRSPRSSATAKAVASWSPVSIQTSTPRRRSARSTARASGRGASATATAPTTEPSSATKTAVFAARRQPATAFRRSGSSNPRSSTPASRMRPSEPTASDRPSASAQTTPLPSRSSAFDTGSVPSLRTAAASISALAMGCAECCSAAAASAKTRFFATEPSANSPASSGWPVVSVPVLSRTTQDTAWAASSTAPPLTSTPCRAPTPVPTMTAVGVARPNAQGHATTTTDTAKSSAKRNGSRSSSQASGMAPLRA